MLKAPKSANKASTPVKASRMPPSCLQPSVLRRIKNSKAKPGLKALSTLWSNLARLYIPNMALKASQIITIGANVVAILLVPSGWIRKRHINMPAVVPTTVDLLMPGATTSRPCTAPRTDWAGVKTPSDITIDTARTPMTLSTVLANTLFSRPRRR